ncbi:MAG: T9SS type A sorting domain-containing protein [Bacteroidales bacterium]|nr:T9SS type A sorting domain-containing protein [Bacteroidales bacterium]
MKNTLLLFTALVFGFGLFAQRHAVKQEIKSESAIFKSMAKAPVNLLTVGKQQKVVAHPDFKNTDAVSVISIGTSANAFGYGYGGGQKNLLSYNPEVNVLTNFHRMGGVLDPGGYSGDLGYDISVDGGMTWTNMVECYVATENAGGTYFTDAGRYPNHGLYNPAGNTDPNEAYVTFFAPNLDGSNEPDGFGGYSFGRAKVGDVLDTTKHLRASRPLEGIFQYTPDGYCVTSLGDVWVTDNNGDFRSTPVVYQGNLIVNHGTWNEAEMEFVYEEMLFDLEIQPGLTLPAFQDVEFAPDGLTGYVLALADDGSIDISKDQSYFPIIWRTEDGGETWSDPVSVALAGDGGIGGVQNYLSDEEITELFLEPYPARDEIPFTTSFDCDLSVDKFGNPHIAVICGVTGSTAYSIASGNSPSSGHAFTCAFLLSSMDKGEEGTWIGYELGRPVSFRGTFSTDFDEDNRIQISRDSEGSKMFVSWLDTDTTVASDNTAPDIWTRGVDVVQHLLTVNEDGDELPVNVTFGSEATFSAYFFAQANEVISDGSGNYIIPYTYENMVPTDPGQPVQFKYIQDFMFNDADFTGVGIDEKEKPKTPFAEVSLPIPNPARTQVRIEVTLAQPAMVKLNVLNMKGQVVLSVPEAPYRTGRNLVNIDVSDFVSGVYFYKLSSGTESVTKKLIVE